ncbi:MAG: Gfo/Idh/MocA family oxidoreductase [Alicyclobacillus sp.]|nr:Gfo/Idh/MocA family oxidoreductase [Alicyclobacillus sp.]
MEKRVRIGIIGVGQIGKFHLNRYAAIPDVDIVAAADVNESELRAVAERFNIPHTYTDFRQLLARDDLDAVDVCLHNNFHAPVSIAALEAGKHVYCEKPIAGSYVDGKAMVEAAAAYGKMLHIQMATLYEKETRVAKHLIDSGDLGRLYHARATGYRRRGRPYVDGYGSKFFVNKTSSAGGALYDMGIYHIAQMLYLLGLPTVSRISGKIYQETEMDEQRRRDSDYNVEELAMGFVKFEGGTVLDIIESWAIQLNAFEGSYVVGSKGGIRLHPFSYHTVISDIAFDLTTNLDELFARWMSIRENEDAYQSSQHHWVAALQGRVELLPTKDIALQTALISEGIYMSDALGREVSAEEVIENSRSTAVKL